jgi:hypothetical protein
MSLPSLAYLTARVDLTSLSPQEHEKILVEAMRRDLGPALELLHKKAHEAKQNGVLGYATWEEDPNSEIGKMLIRIHAGDVLRRLASKYFCHDMELTFYNCCGGRVGKPPKEEEQTIYQILVQNGTLGSADC